ncbi:DUF3137 domain-containing protein [Pedobacter sp.]|uniref:DUF3137 domain-containing protein n=1 Tax=Pedobacter sp. TaxID=1411316 RepID=UPI0031E11AC0
MSTYQPSQIQVLLEELETVRLKIARKYYAAYWCIGLGIITFVICFCLGAVLVAFIEILILIVIGSIMFSLGNKDRKQYRSIYKQGVIVNMLEGIDGNLQVNPNSGISPTDFVDSFLFGEKPDAYKTEDLVYGEIGKTTIHFAEVGAQVHRGRGYEDIFKGIFFCASFNKHFDGLTLIRPQSYTGSAVNWVSRQVSGDARVVNLENTDFNNTFFTQTSNQIEARYLLTPAMMEKLLVLNQYADSTIFVSFVWSNIYIAFPLNHDYFEPPVFKSLLSEDLLKKDIEILKLMYGIVEELDLNTRIWTKQ